MLWLTIATSLGTVTVMQLLAHKKRWGWIISIINQPLWLAVILLSHTWGLLILQGFMLVTAVQGWRNWAKNAK